MINSPKLRLLTLVILALAALSLPSQTRADAGDLYEADSGSGTVYKFSQSGAKSVFAAGLSSPISLAFDSAGNLFVGESGIPAITKFTPAGAKTTFATGVYPYSMRFNSAGTLFVGDGLSKSIVTFTPAGAEARLLPDSILLSTFPSINRVTSSRPMAAPAMCSRSRRQV